MQSIRTIYRQGRGPSSSHTMGPMTVALHARETFLGADRFCVTLYSSLAATGRGHMTDQVLAEVFAGTKLDLQWESARTLPRHPNAMTVEAFRAGDSLGSLTAYSIGGGAVLYDGEEPSTTAPCYSHTSMHEIVEMLTGDGRQFWEYVAEHEGESIWEHLATVWQVMDAAMRRGLEAEGLLPGDLGLARKASSYYQKALRIDPKYNVDAKLAAYALAVSEENASCGEIVTAPTCGSCGVLPAVLRLYRDMAKEDTPPDALDRRTRRALATAGLVGALVRENASISGAEVGCQGEIGTACAMAAAAFAQLSGGTIRQIEYAAEMGLEHSLGLTCDPIHGLVQVPCIERNAHAATRAISCANYALLSDGNHLVSFDDVVGVMKETGNALPAMYRETSTGGLANLR